MNRFSRLHRLLGLAVALAWAASGRAAEPNAKPGAPAPGKPYVLFMGADLEVQREKKYYRVEDVTGSELKIRIGQREFFVPTRNRGTNLKVDNSLKLARGSVVLDNLESGPAYTPANDPRLKFARESGAAGGAAAVQDLAHGRMIAAGMDMAMAGQDAGYAKGSSFEAGAQKGYEQKQAEFGEAMVKSDMAGDMMRSAQFNTGAYADKMQGELAEGNYDAMEVSFKVSSGEALDDPYMIVLFRFQERDAKPGEMGLLIHAKALEPIGPQPKYIRVRESGLPRGFKYVDSEVHIYNRGREIATNTSSKRVELSREEAQQYLMIEYLGANKGATVPAGVVRGTLPPALRQTLSLDQLNRAFYVRIGPDGAVLGTYADEACNLQFHDQGILAALNEVFFKPALVKGKPVAGVARVQLGEI
jgi:hypothetical protein